MKALLEVFYQPGKTFAALPERNFAWIWPLLFVSLIGTLGYWLVTHYIGVETIARQQLEQYARNMPPEQMQQAIAQAATPARMYISYASGFVGAIIAMLVIAGAFMAFAQMSSRAPRFGTMLAMVTLAWFPYALVVTAMSWLVLAISPDPTSLDYRNLLATNVGAFMNRNETSKGLYALMSSMDVLSFVEIFLLALGFSKVTKSKLGFGLGVVIGLWLVVVLIKMGFSMIFG